MGARILAYYVFKRNEDGIFTLSLIALTKRVHFLIYVYDKEGTKNDIKIYLKTSERQIDIKPLNSHF